MPEASASGSAAKQRRHRRHHDRAEPQQRRLVDGLFGRLSVLALRLEREVDHHDRVLLHDADEQHDADERDDAEVVARGDEREDRADAGRRQGRKNRERVDEALVEHAQHDVDRHDRRQDQPAFVRERSLEGERRALEARAEGGRQPDLLRRAFNGLNRFAERSARRQVERERRRRELRLVVDREGRVGGRDLRQRLQRHLVAVRGRHVDVGERGRVLAVLRLELEDDVVLVQLREDRRHLPLAEGAVERVVHRLRGDAEARGRVAIDRQIRAKAAVLLVRRDVLQLRRVAQRFEELPAPEIELRHVGVLEAVLILRAADPILDREVLHRLHVERDPGEVRHAALQAPDDSLDAGRALGERLQVDLHAAAVGRHVRAVDADERRDALDGRVLQQIGDKRLLALGHALERHGLRRLGDADDHAGILDGKKALRHDVEQRGGRDERDREDHQRGALALQHPRQRPAIRVDQLLERLVEPAREPAFLFLRHMLQDARRHHRRQRQRDHRRDQDRHAQRHRELAEEPSDDVAHEEQRDEHRDERDGQRHDREADLRRALQGRVERPLALLDIPRDVLDHHDRIVDDEAGRDGERHQREVVQAEPEHVHHAKRADERQGHGDSRDQRGAQRAQEEEDDHHDEPDRQQELELDVFDRGADGRRAVGEDGHLHGRRQRRGELRQERLDAVDDRDRVGAGLTLDVEDDGRRRVHPRGLMDVFDAVDDVGDVGDADGPAVLVGDDERLVRVAGRQLVVGADGVRLLGPVEGALGLVGVGVRDRQLQLRKADAVGRQRRRVRLDADRRLLAAADRHQPDAGEL